MDRAATLPRRFGGGLANLIGVAAKSKPKLMRLFERAFWPTGERLLAMTVQRAARPLARPMQRGHCLSMQPPPPHGSLLDNFCACGRRSPDTALGANFFSELHPLSFNGLNRES